MKSLILATLFCAAANAAPFTTVLFFGDSLMDTGNSLFLSGVPTAPYFNGRFSNGPVWTEFLAEGLFPGFGSLAGPAFAGQGNNLAVGGALSADVSSQVGALLSALNGSTFPGALHVLGAGGNDVIAARQNFGNGAAGEAAVRAAAAALASSVTRLFNAGARDFFVPNLADVGLTPFGRLEPATMRALTIAFNAELAAQLAALQASTGANIITFDTFSFFNQLHADALAGGTVFGFTNATIPCFAGIAGSGGADCAISLFADDKHPTTAVHSLFGSQFLNAVNAPSQDVPEPSTLPHCLAAAGLLAAGRRFATLRGRP